MKKFTSPRDLKIAIVGATGAVGREVIKILCERWDERYLSHLKLFSSAKSVGQLVSHGKFSWTVEALSEEAFDIVFFTAGSKVSEAYAHKFAKAGALVIDNSSLFRMDQDVPLVVPEINGQAISLAVQSGRRIVANPNCTTAQMVMVLKPLHDAFKIKRVILASYQAVSGKGQQGVEEFQKQLKDFQGAKVLEAKAFSHPIVFNCLPHIDVFQPDGFTGEEQKVMNETKKILSDATLKVVATCVRVPVLNCHSESVNIETERPVSVEAARNVIESMPGVRLYDNVEKFEFPLASLVSGKDEVYVGRIRKDPSVDNGLCLWIVGDNLRKGAALNAVQIAEYALDKSLV